MGSGFLGTRNTQRTAFLGTANPLGFLAPDVPKPGFLKVGTHSRFWVPGNGNPNLTLLDSIFFVGVNSTSSVVSF